MTNTNNKKKEFKPLNSILMIAAGLMFLITRLLKSISLGEADSWETLDILKVVVGIFAIGFGIYKLIKKK